MHELWRAPAPLILASKSRVRAALLESAAIPFEVKPASIDERAIEATASDRGPAEVALLLAAEKSRAVSERYRDRIVLGADQTLACGGRRYSKPPSREIAMEQLNELRGRAHQLHSAVCLSKNGNVLFHHVGTATLTMRAFSDEFLQAYCDATGPALIESVGSYQLERTGIHLFERIDGDHFTVLGLPLLPLLQHCRKAGYLAS